MRSHKRWKDYTNRWQQILQVQKRTILKLCNSLNVLNGE